MEPDEIGASAPSSKRPGIQYVVSAPWRNDLDDWLRSMDLLAGIVAS